MGCVICERDTTATINGVRLASIVCGPCFLEWNSSPERKRAENSVKLILSTSTEFADFVRRRKAERQNGVTR